ncbi:MAG: DUF3012 domain-containing protein [Pseudomonadales bacterium]
MKHAALLAATIALSLTLSGCAPEVGSPRWCEKMEDKPKGDWTANEAGEYAKSCILGLRDEPQR